MLSSYGHKNAIDVQKELEESATQYLVMKKELNGADRFPKTYDKHTQQLKTSDAKWWCSGFYPGTLLYLHEATGNMELYGEALRMLRLLKNEQYNTDTHDVGFMMYCSYGNAERIAPRLEYREILINSAKSLCSRFSPITGCIKSHNRNLDEYIVIIDNLMNLELLFRATKITGDSSYYHIAVTHANTTLKNHFRQDYSLYHAINYNPDSGSIQNYVAGQGYSEKSAWARGQAWGLYGYTMIYRETSDTKYLVQAFRIADFILNHPNLAKDKVPYWDFDAPGIPDALQDASAGAIICSALLELCQYVDKKKSKIYFDAAKTILKSLSSARYKAPSGSNGGFILNHSVGNIPAGTEVDVPLTYADYYYVEALLRYKKIKQQ
jgi:hypothetical protein